MRFQLPTDKHDAAAAHTVRSDPKGATEALPALMEWVQDSNWPVARALAPCLPLLGDPFLRALHDVLRQHDATWAWHALSLLSPHLTATQRAALGPVLRRLETQSTVAESAEGLPELAQQIISHA